MIPREVYQHTLRQFFAPIVPFLDDDSVTEILINGPSTILIERAGTLTATDARFEHEEALLAAIRHLAQYVGRTVGEVILSSRRAFPMAVGWRRCYRPRHPMDRTWPFADSRVRS